MDTLVIRSYYELLSKHWEGHPLPADAAYYTPLALLVDRGLVFSPVVVTDKRRGVMKACYRNAGRLVMKYPDRYVYVEGIAVISEELPIPVSHAWVWDRKKEEALELTWETPGSEYLGIPFKYDFMRGMALARGFWGILDARVMITTEADPEKYLEELTFSS